MLESCGSLSSVVIRAEIGSAANHAPKAEYPIAERRRTSGVMQKRTGLFGLGRAGTNFERLVRPHLDHLYRLAYRFTGARDRAEDLVQDLLVRVYPRRAELAQIEQPRPWLARVMYRIFVDQFRRNARAPFVPISEHDVESDDDKNGDGYRFADPAPGPEAETELNFERELLVQAWEHLSPEHRVLLALHDVEGYTLSELERVLNVTRGTLKSRLSRARARLAALLERERFEPVVRVQSHIRG